MPPRPALVAALLILPALAAGGAAQDGVGVTDVADIDASSASQVTVSQDVDLDTGDVLAYLALRGGESPWEALAEDGGFITLVPAPAPGWWLASAGCDGDALAYAPGDVLVARVGDDGATETVYTGGGLASLRDEDACDAAVACYGSADFTCRLAQNDAQMRRHSLQAWWDAPAALAVDRDDVVEGPVTAATEAALEAATGADAACGGLPPVCVERPAAA